MELVWTSTMGVLFAGIRGSEAEAGLQEIAPPKDKTASRLAHRLLTIGGAYVCLMSPENPISRSRITAEGEAVWPTSVQEVDFASPDCHRASIWLWEQRLRRDAVMIGYALSVGEKVCPDGKWMPHTWLVDDAGSIIETRSARRCYFGVRLTPNQTQDLYRGMFGQLPMHSPRPARR